MMITKPFYKDPSTYESKDELIDYVRHLQSEMFNVIDQYNKLETSNQYLQAELYAFKRSIKMLLDDD